MRFTRTLITSVRKLAWGLGCTLLWAGVASGQTVTPNTWNVIGLQGNDVSAGPNEYPVGARVCAGAAPLPAGRTAQFQWIDRASGNPVGSAESPYITLVGSSSITLSALAANACQDVYFNVQIARDVAAFGTKAPYRITLMDGATLVAQTPIHRELYVERLIAQNRNSILGYELNGVAAPTGGSIDVSVGGVYEVTVHGKTATQGYEQLEKFLTLPSNLFQVLSVKSTYTANSGTDPNAPRQLYADGCGWVQDYTNPNYHTNLSCTGTGKYGGTVDLTYVLKVLSAPGGGTYQSTAMLYDFSGSSYHYNADSVSAGITFNFVPDPPAASADLSVVKTGSTSTPGNSTFIVTVTNNGPDDAANVIVNDPLPSGYAYKGGANAPNPSVGTYSQVTGVWDIGLLANGASATLTMGVSVGNNPLLNYNNVATVSSATADPVSGNNTSSLSLPQASADLGVSKVMTTPSPIRVGDTVTFAIYASNAGADAAVNAVVSDTPASGLTYVSGSCVAGWTFAWNGTTATCSNPSFAVTPAPIQVMTLTATVNAPPADLTDTSGYANTAAIASGTVDPESGNNNASASAVPTFLTITKQADKASYNLGDTGTYTLQVTKSGTSANLGTVAVQDMLPAGVTASAISGSGWACVLATLTCTRADDLLAGIPPAQPYPPITVNVTFAQGGAALKNVASATATDGLGNVLSYDESFVTVAVTGNYTVTTQLSHAGAAAASTCTTATVASGGNDACAVGAVNAGYVFTGWSLVSGTVGGMCANNAATTTCNITNVTSNVVLQANYNYAVTATVTGGNGTVSCTPASVTGTAPDDQSTCTAVPDSGYRVKDWTGACDPATTAACALTGINGPRASVVEFEPIPNWTVTAQVSVPGAGSVSCTTPTVADGGNDSCTVVPNPGYTFTGWTLASGTAGMCIPATNTTCAITNVKSNVVLQANFVAVTYNVTGNVTDPATGSANCAPSPVAHGANSTCTATPAAGYVFAGWALVGTAINCATPATSATCTVNNVQSAVTMTATFVKAAPTSVPTLSEWGLMLLASLMAALGLFMAPTANRR